MIRTRDVIIFISALLFVLTGIVLTLVFDERNGFHNTTSDPSFESASTTYTAENPGSDLDRESIVDRLRDTLSTTQSEVEPQPSVEESPSVTSDDPQSNPEVQLGIVECGGNDTQNTIQTWPLSDVQIVAEGVFRKVVHGAAPASNSATSSAASSSLPASDSGTTLLTLPLVPVQNANTSCVPGEVVGVTLSGSLMLNIDAPFYQGYGTEYLIGYARDGFPVYGYYEGAVDSCGGYEHSSGYRYTVSSDRPYLIGCFKGTPAPFNL